MLIPVSALCVVLHLAAGARGQGECSGFVLLDFRSAAQIANGQFRGWEGYLDHQAISLSYQFDDGFMALLGAQGQQDARAAVEAALQTWSKATNGRLSFHPSPWVAVPNSDAIVDGGCWANFEGPSCQQWEQMGFPTNPPSQLPGWGANIDFFSKPVGFTLTSGGISYTMTPGILGFAAVYRESVYIRSVDIYLNEAWSWSASASAGSVTAEAPPIAIKYRCGGRRDKDEPPIAPGSMPVFDLQTVVLHELGHALGLDHPNEAMAHGGVLIEPYLFNYLPGSCWQSSQVMHGDYNGVKRDLTPSDIGGMAFLYRPALAGDLEPDDQIDAADAFRAVRLMGGGAQPTPYEVNIMDFVDRNGAIDDLEAASVVAAAFESGETSEVAPPGWTPHPVQSFATAMVIDPSFDPPVMTLGKTSDLVLTLRNPTHRRIRMWTIEVTYDPAVLANPRVLNGTLFDGAIWVEPDAEPGRIRFARVSLIDDAGEAEGSVARVRFDVVGAPAMGGPKPRATPIALESVRILVSDPVLHLFGSLQGNETLIVHRVPALFANLDVSGDGVVGTEDWYAFLDRPFDFNADGATNLEDTRAFLGLMRQTELADITADLVALPAGESAPSGD